MTQEQADKLAKLVGDHKSWEDEADRQIQEQVKAHLRGKTFRQAHLVERISKLMSES
jgi:hypothetical protein